MKKQILIIVSVVVIICSFVACTHNSGSESISTTAVTTINSKSEIEKTYDSSTSAKNEADNIVDFNTVTDNSKTTTVRNNKTEMSTEISTDETTTQTNTTTPQKQSQPITDKDGWINKWY